MFRRDDDGETTGEESPLRVCGVKALGGVSGGLGEADPPEKSDERSSFGYGSFVGAKEGELDFDGELGREEMGDGTIGGRRSNEASEVGDEARAPSRPERLSCSRPVTVADELGGLLYNEMMLATGIRGDAEWDLSPGDALGEMWGERDRADDPAVERNEEPRERAPGCGEVAEESMVADFSVLGREGREGAGPLFGGTLPVPLSGFGLPSTLPDPALVLLAPDAPVGLRFPNSSTSIPFEPPPSPSPSPSRPTPPDGGFAPPTGKL